jgi:hydroxymethylpyrimidine/phosphomethylpyrimidine kinase
MPLSVALENSKAFVTEAIRNSLEIGKGHGPLNHLGEI